MVWQYLICTDVTLFWFHNSTGLAMCFKRKREEPCIWHIKNYQICMVFYEELKSTEDKLNVWVLRNHICTQINIWTLSNRRKKMFIANLSWQQKIQPTCMWQTLGRHVCLRPNVSWAERTLAERVIEKVGIF